MVQLYRVLKTLGDFFRSIRHTQRAGTGTYRRPSERLVLSVSATDGTCEKMHIRPSYQRFSYNLLGEGQSSTFWSYFE